MLAQALLRGQPVPALATPDSYAGQSGAALQSPGTPGSSSQQARPQQVRYAVKDVPGANAVMNQLAQHSCAQCVHAANTGYAAAQC
jgi:hypothetical protein